MGTSLTLTFNSAKTVDPFYGLFRGMAVPLEKSEPYSCSEKSHLCVYEVLFLEIVMCQISHLFMVII